MSDLENKYLDKKGLEYFSGKIKDYVDASDARLDDMLNSVEEQIAQYEMLERSDIDVIMSDINND